MLPGGLDIVGWELRKYLTHFGKSNASILEWLDSPFVYADTGLISRLNALKSRCANPARIVFHYASMFRHAMKDKTEDGAIGIKKLCYALRANLCVRWTLETNTIPPTSFECLRRGLRLTNEEDAAIDRLLDAKASATEAERILPDEALGNILSDRFDELCSVKWPSGCRGDVSAELTRILRDEVKRGK